MLVKPILSDILNPDKLTKCRNVDVQFKRLLNSAYFVQNYIVSLMDFLNTLNLKSDDEKLEFFSKTLSCNLDDLSATLRSEQILPLLIQEIELFVIGLSSGGNKPSGSPTSSGSSPAACFSYIVSIILKISSLDLLTSESNNRFQTEVLPVIAKLFACPDRSIRFQLLTNVNLYIDYFEDPPVEEIKSSENSKASAATALVKDALKKHPASTKVLEDKILPEVISGFTDSNAAIREATVKSMVSFVPKVRNSTKLLENKVVRSLQRIINEDGEASIRTNAVICFGKIATYLPPSIAGPALGHAFTKALRDPFGPCRNAALHALSATSRLFTITDISTRILPIVCQRLVDSEVSVQDTANDVLTMLQKYVREEVVNNRVILPPPDEEGLPSTHEQNNDDLNKSASIHRTHGQAGLKLQHDDKQLNQEPLVNILFTKKSLKKLKMYLSLF